MAFLSLDNVSKAYGAVYAVRDVSIDIEKGEFVSLLGPSGCGKTTTLQMIAGLTEPTAGRIHLDGRDITNLAPNKRGLGVVFQSYALFPHMTVAENVGFGLEMRGIDRSERTRRIADALDLVRLSGFAQRYPREMSGGQRQRVAMARALVIAPPVLLLDEPLSNLDAKLREEMQFELRRIQRATGTTTIMVTHDQAEALSISDRVVVMEAGRTTQIDSPYHLYEHPRTGFISDFVGKTNSFDARIDQTDPGKLLIGGRAIDRHTIAAPTVTADRTGSTLKLGLRPEKIHLCVAGAGWVDGRVAARYFIGSQWLLTVETDLGAMIVAVPNLGNEPPVEGMVVGLDWQAQSLRSVPPGDAAEPTPT